MADRLNSTAGALLGLLRHGPRSGYDLVAAAEEMIGGFWTITRSQVYRELSALADRGLLEKGPAGPRDRQPFQLTPAGRAAFRTWVNTSPEPENLRIPLLLRLTFADEISQENLQAMLAEHQSAHSRRQAHYKSLDRELDAANVPEEQRLTLAFGIGYETAVLEWFRQLPAGLRPGSSPAERS
jgi:DNA-binding PadR family transcriptional regulator